jgi:predicted DNA-binding WGR domain protein
VDASCLALLPKGKVKPSILASADDGELLSASLANVDVAKNHDKFYILQCIDVGGGACHVFAHFGRTGNVGMMDLKGPFDHEEGEAEFVKRFKDKTKNEWADRANFVQKAGHYDLLEVAASAGPAGKWQYYVDDNVMGKVNGWYDYDNVGNKNCEDLWTQYQSNKGYSQRVVDSGGQYSYHVDLTNLTQRNTTSGKQRYIRRLDIASGNVAAISGAFPF